MFWFKNQTMKNLNPGHNADNKVTDLIAALLDMRDKLVNVSLLLKDVQFEMDTQARQSVIEQANALIEKVRF